MPNGILKANWMHKHKNLLPAVVVLMCSWEGNNPNWKESETDICMQLEVVKYALYPHLSLPPLTSSTGKVHVQGTLKFWFV